MKTIARIIFFLHRLFYKYPCRSEVRLGIDKYSMNEGLTWYIGMLYICEESIRDICTWLDLSEKDVKYHLNKIVKGVKL